MIEDIEGLVKALLDFRGQAIGRELRAVPLRDMNLKSIPDHVEHDLRYLPLKTLLAVGDWRINHGCLFRWHAPKAHQTHTYLKS